MAEYPKRESHFAHKFTRLIFRCCLANEIGPEACYMLVQIAHTEDAAHYRKAVTFFNGQLISVCGFCSVQSLIRARTKAIEAGWLDYTPGTKGKAGKYFVKVPDSANGLPDGSVECDYPQEMLLESTPKTLPQAETIRNESGMNPECKPSPFFPIPTPAPNTHTHTPGHKNLHDGQMLPVDWREGIGSQAIDTWCQWFFRKTGNHIDAIQLREQLKECHSWSADKLSRSVGLTIGRGEIKRIYDADQKLPARTNGNGKPVKEKFYPPMAPVKPQ